MTTYRLQAGTKMITRAELVNMLLATAGATFISIVAKTEPKMRKTNNPHFGKITKVAYVNGCVNFHYDEGVLRRLAKEGKTADSFRQGESWHTPVIVNDRLTPLCQHKTSAKMYLRFMLRGRIEAEFINTETFASVNEADLEPFLIKSDYANQGLDDPLIFLTYGIENIHAITINNESYMVN